MPGAGSATSVSSIRSKICSDITDTTDTDFRVTDSEFKRAVDANNQRDFGDYDQNNSESDASMQDARDTVPGRASPPFDRKLQRVASVTTTPPPSECSTDDARRRRSSAPEPISVAAVKSGKTKTAKCESKAAGVRKAASASLKSAVAPAPAPSKAPSASAMMISNEDYGQMVRQCIAQMRQQKERLTAELNGIENQKRRLHSEIRQLSDQLAKLNLQMAQKTQFRAELTRTIRYTVKSYEKLMETSQNLIKNVKKETLRGQAEIFSHVVGGLETGVLPHPGPEDQRTLNRRYGGAPASAQPNDDGETYKDGMAIASRIARELKKKMGMGGK